MSLQSEQAEYQDPLAPLEKVPAIGIEKLWPEFFRQSNDLEPEVESSEEST